MMKSKLLMGAGYGAFALSALVVGLYLTFPAQAVGQRLAHEVQRKSQGAVSISFDEVSLYRFSGVEAENVRVRAQKDGQQPIEVTLDSVRARLRLLPLLLLSTSIDAEIELGQGEISATITPGNGGELSAALELDKVNLSSPPLLPMLVGLPVGGVVTGDVSADLRKDAKATFGSGKLTITGASLGPGVVQGFTVPSVDLGDLELEVAVDGGRARIESKQNGGQVQAKISGTTNLRSALESSQLDLCLELKADPAFLDKNPTVKTALQLAEIRLKKNPQGFLNVPLGGTVGRPNVRSGLCRGAGRD